MPCRASADKPQNARFRGVFPMLARSAVALWINGPQLVKEYKSASQVSETFKVKSR
jgi:hypothetical protein